MANRKPKVLSFAYERDKGIRVAVSMEAIKGQPVEFEYLTSWQAHWLLDSLVKALLAHEQQARTVYLQRTDQP